MESITVAREMAADPEAVRAALSDLRALMEAAGFDEVAVEDDGETIRIANAVALLRIELDLAVVEDPETDLTYRQREGIFEEMETRYVVEATDGGSRVTVTTDFALGAPFAGPLLDATVIKRQRGKELTDQLDYLEEATG